LNYHYQGQHVFHNSDRSNELSALGNVRGELHAERAAATAGNQRRAHARDTAILMRLNAKFGFERGWCAARVAGLFLALSLCAAPLAPPSAASPGSHERGGRNHLEVADSAAISAAGNHSEIRNYFMDFDGDHSLDVATVIEQSSAGFTKYTVQLHLASGVEQSVVVSAPPGGLQVEMQDMTGDKIQNDVVLRPALLRWLPTVLVNDGHEHFEVAVSGTDPRSFSSSEDLGSRRRDSQSFALLMSSGFKALHLPNRRTMFDPHLQECLFSSFTQTVSDRLGHASSSGRAPPPVKAI
jgi:hypothetical protein